MLQLFECEPSETQILIHFPVCYQARNDYRGSLMRRSIHCAALLFCKSAGIDLLIVFCKGSLIRSVSHIFILLKWNLNSATT